MADPWQIVTGRWEMIRVVNSQGGTDNGHLDFYETKNPGKVARIHMVDIYDVTDIKGINDVLTFKKGTSEYSAILTKVFDQNGNQVPFLTGFYWNGSTPQRSWHAWHTGQPVP